MRRAPAAGRQDPARPRHPRTLRAASLLWLVAAVLLLVSAGSFAGSAALPGSDSTALTGLAAVLGALAVLQLVLLLRLRRGRRSARELLSTVGIIAGLPVLVRGTPGLSVIAVVMLLAVVLMWLPASSAYFQVTDPKARKKRGLPGT
ncbi:hypothetical protein [Arthrobacter zhaoguopingii]|uniref:hypothetical protein n=1 Tax=Arthrobacter zhaoguopingii TaxID=2681491 RepID=UPI001359583F|nr:hypothetical protein [Arthrobacter zhaoguopingii]